jgi:hypothetical protein
MSKRKYVKKDKPVETEPVKLSDFNKDLAFLATVKPPKKGSKQPSK